MKNSAEVLQIKCTGLPLYELSFTEHECCDLPMYILLFRTSQNQFTVRNIHKAATFKLCSWTHGACFPRLKAAGGAVFGFVSRCPLDKQNPPASNGTAVWRDDPRVWIPWPERQVVVVLSRVSGCSRAPFAVTSCALGQCVF